MQTFVKDTKYMKFFKGIENRFNKKTRNFSNYFVFRDSINYRVNDNVNLLNNDLNLIGQKTGFRNKNCEYLFKKENKSNSVEFYGTRKIEITTMKKSLEKYLTENSHLVKTERDKILDSFCHVSIAKNKFWIKKGEICKHLAFVDHGILRIINEINEIESTVQLVYKNTFVTSLTSFAYQIPGIWSIQALTDCDLLLIDRDTHFKLINEFKNWLEVDNVQLLLAYTDLENRLFSQFHLSAEQRFNKLFSERPDIFNQVPLKHIASSIGITPETLSRLRKKHLR
jgi:CRP/FNR family transcriptional regulator, anaerobic regulatory protein